MAFAGVALLDSRAIPRQVRRLRAQKAARRLSSAMQEIAGPAQLAPRHGLRTLPSSYSPATQSLARRRENCRPISG